jgi:hypothetical protein
MKENHHSDPGIEPVRSARSIVSEENLKKYAEPISQTVQEFKDLTESMAKGGEKLPKSPYDGPEGGAILRKYLMVDGREADIVHYLDPYKSLDTIAGIFIKESVQDKFGNKREYRNEYVVNMKGQLRHDIVLAEEILNDDGKIEINLGALMFGHSVGFNDVSEEEATTVVRLLKTAEPLEDALIE